MSERTPFIDAIKRTRRAGVLLHPSSLPGPLANGDIGHQAYRFIEFLKSSGFKVWQMLPLGVTHDDGSPYQCLSSHAGNPLLISLDWIIDKGWLDTNKIKLDKTDKNYRLVCLMQAGDYFYQLENKYWLERIEEFSSQHSGWLHDFALFMSLKKNYENKPWYEWPESIKKRDPIALLDAQKNLINFIKQTIFEQFVFFTQWHEVRQYAKQHDIELFGDIPIFVAKDSAEVWAQRDNFLIDSDGEMQVVAGVPPDAFSETGQRWGNPLYDWDHMQSTEFSWWKQRFATQLELFDIVRLDHFRGLEACWQIPQDDDTAISGEWVQVPGMQMLMAINDKFHHLPLVAEDLGVITEKVIELKNHFNFPGMKVLQFAFDGNNNNPHLPHCHKSNDIIYTGTHDNDTSLGWANNENNYNKLFFEDYLGQKNESNQQAVFALIRLAMSSVSFLSIIPMQDILMLDESARMNTPGTIENNWQWRFDWPELKPETLQTITHLLTLYQR